MKCNWQTSFSLRDVRTEWEQNPDLLKEHSQGDWKHGILSILSDYLERLKQHAHFHLTQGKKAVSVLECLCLSISLACKIMK